MDPGPVTNRRRPAVACTECRRRKVRCNRIQPCTPCSKSRPPLRCVYNNGHKTSQNPNSDINTSALPPQASIEFDTDLFAVHMTHLPHLKHVESDYMNVDQDWGFLDFDCSPHNAQKIATVKDKSPSIDSSSPAWTSISSQSQASSSISVKKKHANKQSELSLDTRSIESDRDTRWCDALSRCSKLQFIVHAITSNRPLRDSSVSLNRRRRPEQNAVLPLMEAFATMEQVTQHCKCPPKELRLLPPSPTGVNASGQQLADLLPPRPVADALLNAYLRTFESVLRIIFDVSSFLRDYQRVWSTSSSAHNIKWDQSFQCKVLTAMAIGSCTCANLDMAIRKQAHGWVSYAKRWLAWRMGQHSRPDFDMAQVACLVSLASLITHLPTSFVGGGHDLTNMAIQIGLHREPRIRTPTMSEGEAERRRCLWTTMLELSLQHSFDQRLPSPIAPESYDCEWPSLPNHATNVNMDLSSLLARSQRLRLKILQLINAPHASRTYNGMYQLATEMNDVCSENVDALRNEQQGSPNQNRFHLKLLELFTRPFVLGLHEPFADQASGNPAFYYSRKTRLETSILLLEYPDMLPVPRNTTVDNNTNVARDDTMMSVESTNAPIDEYYRSLCIHGQGHFGLVQRKATAALCVDLIGELEENAFPTVDGASREKLRNVLRNSVRLHETRVSTSRGTHSAREFVIFSCAEAYIGAMMDKPSLSSPSIDVDWAISRAARRALAMCCEFIEIPHRNELCDECTGVGDGEDEEEHDDVIAPTTGMLTGEGTVADDFPSRIENSGHVNQDESAGVWAHTHYDVLMNLDMDAEDIDTGLQPDLYSLGLIARPPVR